VTNSSVGYVKQVGWRRCYVRLETVRLAWGCSSSSWNNRDIVVRVRNQPRLGRLIGVFAPTAPIGNAALWSIWTWSAPSRLAAIRKKCVLPRCKIAKAKFWAKTTVTASDYNAPRVNVIQKLASANAFGEARQLFRLLVAASIGTKRGHGGLEPI